MFIQQILEATRGLRRDLNSNTGHVTRLSNLLTNQATLMAEMAATIEELEKEVARTRWLTIDLAVRRPAPPGGSWSNSKRR